MKLFFRRLLSSVSFLAAVSLPACSASGVSSSDATPDATDQAPEAEGGSDAATARGDVAKPDAGVSQPAAGPVAVLNLSYVNNVSTLSTDVTFVLRNSANQRIEKIRSVKLLFDETEVATWNDLSFCPEWLTSASSTSPVLTMSVAMFDTDDYNATAFVSCSGGSSGRTRGQRPRATRSAIGKGAVTVVVNGVLSDATAFVGQAQALAP